MDVSRCYEAGKAATEQWVEGPLVRTAPLLGELKSDLKRLQRRVLQKNGAATAADDPDRWLLDNLYLIELAAQSAMEGLRGVRKLPVLGGGGADIRLVVLARSLMEQPESLTEQEVIAFLKGAQSNTPLLERELRALLFGLQFVSVGQLADLLNASQETREAGFSRIFAHLRRWNDLDFQIIAEQASQIHAAFLADPTGDYARMPPRDRAGYRRRLETMARREKSEEAAFAKALVERAGKEHIGFLLFGRDSVPFRAVQSSYFPALTLGSLLLSLGLGFFVGAGWSFVLFWLPLFGILKALTDVILLRILPRRPVFRLSLAGGLTPAERTLLVKTTVLTGENSFEEIRKLECIFLANRDCGEALSLGLLADFPERSTPVNQQDRELIHRMESALDQLNRRYDGRFFLFVRSQVYQQRQGTFAGWERKRGALLELARMLRSRRSELQVHSGDRTRLNGVRYLVTLDSDTDPGVGGIRPLVGAMCHPLNRPELDGSRGVVSRGYAVIQPQIRTALSAARATPFARLFSGGAGTDPYRGTGSELCHDLFDASSFCGKGILDIDCFLACLDGRIPERQVLSHDILEGAFLRTGYLSQISFSDGFPGSVKGFFKRQHRWVRGDWQNLPWVFGTIPTPAGREPNPLSGVSRWKLVDNLRRSLTPIAQLICVALGVLFGGKLTWFTWIGLGSLALEPLLGLAGNLFGRRRARHFHARVWSNFGQAALQIAVKLILLPLEAWTNASALWLALWRSLISHKNMLQWTTFAQQGAGGEVLRPSVPMWVSGLLLGIASLPLRRPGGLLLAAFWLLAPLAVAALERRAPKPSLHAEEQAFLLHQAEQIWNFFADFLTPERNFLPPDNYQLRPYQGPAERTSPTNIGFAALSCLAAIDLELEAESQVLERIAGLLDTLERMEKWRGNLYNWYHTVTLEPMAPKVVSSVDSGNLCGCLLALSTGLRELGRDDLSERALRLVRETELGALYDRSKHLFYISYEPDTDTWSSAHYDLMASEARLLSYVALGLGQVEHRHWAALSRAQAEAKGYQGMVSWFGTMFEYFMPHLLLPLPEDSFLYESLAFCACEQVRFGRKRGIPWGISESALPALDQNGCYSYRANGVSSIALCHMPEREPVVAPYATYLTLSLLPHRAVDNLQRLRENGLEGKYGLYEAAEYSRQGISAAKSWMSHHMGMSLVAIDNALLNQIQVKRFMALPEMEAFASLLEEAVPRAAAPLRRKQGHPAPERQTNAKPGWRLEGTGVSEETPVCALLSGHEQSAVVTNSGYCWLTGAGESLTARRMPPAFYLKKQGKVIPLFPTPPGASVSWRLGERDCDFTHHGDGFQAKLIIVSTQTGALQWKVELSDVEEESTLFFVLCPQLAPERDFLAHPAFSLLRLESEHTAGAVTFRRRGRQGSHTELRCRWPGHGTIQSVTGPEATERLAQIGLPAEEPCLLLEMPVKGCAAEFTLQMDAGQEEKLWKQPQKSQPKLLDLISSLLPELVFASQLGRAGNPGPQRLLWSLGISGDDPIVFSGLPQEKDRLLLLTQAWKLMKDGGIPFDLVFCGSEERRAQVQHWLGEKGLGLGGHRGLHFVPDRRENRELLQGMACADLDHLPERETTFPTTGQSCGWQIPNPSGPMVEWQKDSVTLRGKLPPVRWSIPLSNGTFGYLALDNGGGYLWARNARMFRITPWDNNPRGLEGPENLAILLSGKENTLFAGRDETPWSVTFGSGFLRWEKWFDGDFHTTVTAFVPPNRNERVFLLQFQNTPPETELVWRLKPQMGEHLSQGLWSVAQVSEGKVWLSNPVTQRSGICLSASVPWKTLWLPEGRRRAVELTFSATDALVLQIGEPCSSLTPEQGEKLLEETAEVWRSRCGRLQVETPDPALNHYLSFWGQYQVQASRMLSRTSVYQCGGAYGFRDQLQDCCALIHTNTPLVREHILRCCRHQFMEGDVLHWWHEHPDGGADAGVRTRISDDLLWLPYALSVWWEETGARELLEQQVPYLIGQRLGPEEHDRYFTPELGSQTESVYLHGIRALECVLGRGVGKHGLCKMGSGDWNDGMDKVGAAGQGESVWLTWFAALVLCRFSAVCQAMEDSERGSRYRETANSLARAAGQCWDGDWFLRGYFDSGEALGGKTCPECQIDSISQSFAALVCEDRAKTRHALERAEGLLADWNSGTVALLSPPFDGKGPNPGYIADYRPGNRENGGQYTHGAVWLALAWFHLGEPDRGWRVLKNLLPEHHPLEQYQGEPFVLAADVCRESGKEGAAGWTWYTGAAGWYWRVAVQQMLGLRFRGGLLYLEPHLPRDWPGYRAKLRLERGMLEIAVATGKENRLLLDCEPVSQGIDCGSLSGEHTLRLEILRKRGCASGENHV